MDKHRDTIKICKGLSKWSSGENPEGEKLDRVLIPSAGSDGDALVLSVSPDGDPCMGSNPIKCFVNLSTTLGCASITARGDMWV